MFSLPSKTSGCSLSLIMVMLQPHTKIYAAFKTSFIQEIYLCLGNVDSWILTSKRSDFIYLFNL